MQADYLHAFASERICILGERLRSSFYIRTLVECLQAYKSSDHLGDVTKRKNGRFAQKGYPQVPAHNSQLNEVVPQQRADWRFNTRFQLWTYKAHELRTLEELSWVRCSVRYLYDFVMMWLRRKLQ